MVFGRHINKYYLKYLPLILLGVLSLALVDYFQLIVPKLYREVVNGLNGNIPDFNSEYVLKNICEPMIVVIVAMVTGRFLWRICLFGSAIKVETQLRRKMFDVSKNLSQQYYQVNKVGNLMSLFTNDLETIQDCFGSGIMMFCDAALLGFLAIYNMLKMNKLLTLFTLIPMVLLAIIAIIVGNSMSKKWDERQEAFSALSDFSQESFSGIAVIKAFVKQLNELLAFKKLNRKNEKVNIEYTKISSLLHILVTLFVESVICIILGYGGYLVYKGVFDAGQLVEFIGYFNAIIWPIMAVSELIDMQSRGKASLKRVSELLDAKPDVVDDKNAIPLTNAKGTIEFKNLTFKYPCGDYNALTNVSFKINAGENVGITGKTGSGKTTIADLILRTYNVPDGCIFIDGQDINTLTVKSVRENAAYVPQDNFLFSDTIANNIAFASDTTDQDLIERSATLAAVADNIEEFDDKYQTVLGERGVTVSGGQKQRISIARALMKNAPLLILDDALSAVDTDTERQLLHNLAKERKGKTTIMISHRISTVEGMDKIIFIDDGKIIACGTHEELLVTCEEYARTVQLQKLEKDEGEKGNA